MKLRDTVIFICSWLTRHWRLLISFGAFGLSIWTSVSYLPDAVTGAVVGAGIPAIYYLYKEWELQPRVEIVSDRVEHVMAPSKLKSKEIGLHKGEGIGYGATEKANINLYRPLLYSKIKLKNTGRASAKKCILKVDDEENNITYNGRWSLPENPERYNLMPGEVVWVHLFVTNLSRFWSIPVQKSTELTRRDKVVDIGEEVDRPDKIEEELEKNLERFQNSFKPMTFHPQHRLPEREGTTIGGAWRRKELPHGEYNFSVKVIAEDYTNKAEPIGSLKIPGDLLKKIANSEVNWQKQWRYIIPDYEKKLKSLTEKVCKEWKQ